MKMESFTKECSEGLRGLFEPASIAVIGASNRPDSVGFAVLHNLVSGGFKGRIYPVNPKTSEIKGLQVYPSVSAIPASVDLAILIVPGAVIPDILRECSQKNVRASVIISAGFRETGPAGKAMEDQVLAAARQYKISILGPNCLGLMNTNPEISMNASFSRTMPKAGNISVISQSGALCTAILDYAKGKNIGFSRFISLGNKSDITELDILRYLKNDPDTDVILMYLEDLVDGRAFIELAREITGEIRHAKPILVIKSGRTLQGAQAASSHTGSLMGSDEVYDAIFAQAGVLRVDSVEEMFHHAVGFANQPLPAGKRVAIVTNAGGPGIMATDACVRYGLEMSRLQPKTQEALKKVLPPTSSFSNPVDVIGDAGHERYESAIEQVLADPEVDSMIVILTPQAMTAIEETAHVIVRADQKSAKPVLACFMGIVDVSAGVRILESNHVPHYVFPEDAARTLGAMVRYRNWIIRPRTEIKKFKVDSHAAGKIIKETKAKSTLLPIQTCMDILQAYGFPLLPCGFSESASEAVSRAKKIGFPVAVKVASSRIVHKLDIGGVRLNLKNEKELKAACTQMIESISRFSSKSDIEGFFVQGMSKPGKEVILGMKRDPHFGPILMFGLGGTYVEVLKDVTFRLAPVRELGAARMVESIRSYPILRGIRGESPSDIKAIIEMVERLSQLACDHPMISEIDINPLMVHPVDYGASVLDARIILDHDKKGACSK